MEFIKDTIKRMDEMFETDVKSINKRLIELAKSYGGKAYLVGGSVRDSIMGIKQKDNDYVITKVPKDDLIKKLQHYFPEGTLINTESSDGFGAIKLKIAGVEYDIVLPRTDKDRLNVTVDENIPIEQDLLRRDLTINAIAKDLETGELIQPPGYDCISDIKNKIIRSVGKPFDRFKEDPLRILRAIQFSNRLGFEIEPNTYQGIKENIDKLNGVKMDRFREEFVKGWTRSKNTDRFFKLLIDTNIGMLLFGSQFNPIPLERPTDMSDGEFFFAQYIAAFLNGGNYQRMGESTTDHAYIETAKLFKAFIDNGIDYNMASKLKNKEFTFDTIIKAFGLIDDKTNSQLQPAIKSILSKPLIPRQNKEKARPSWHLPIDAKDLNVIVINLGKPELKGKSIGDTVTNLIKMYQSGEITASDDDNVNKQTIETVLKDKLLKESCVKDASRLDTIKKRINNIYNQ